MSVIVIILGFVVHFIILIPISAINWVIPITLFVLCYLISFSILYAVKLIGDCLELFFIINSIEILLDDNKENDAVELKDKYNNFRIMALETIVLTNNGIECIDAYCNTIKKLIESDSNLPSDEKTSLLNMHKKHFYK